MTYSLKDSVKEVGTMSMSVTVKAAGTAKGTAKAGARGALSAFAS